MLLDLQLPDASGLDGLTAVKQAYPSVTVIVLSATEHPETIIAALKLGASGFIPKSSSHETLVGAMELVIRHNAVYIPLQVLGVQPRGPAILRSDPETVAANTDELLEQLGIHGRMKDVFVGLIDAKPLKVIARKLNIAESTVKSHARSIYIALRVKNRVELLVRVAELGIAFNRKRPTGQ
jgi:DNA-binding NarL/FixJ family response regulator